MRPLAVARYLLVPLDPSLLLAILYFGVALTLAEHAGVLGMMLLLGTASLAFCYGFALLDHVREGRRRPLVLSTDVLQTYGPRAVCTLLLVVLLAYLTYRLERASHSSAAAGVRLAALALFPAMLGVMSTTARFHEALNPLTIADTVARMRAGYPGLLLVVGVLWAVPLALFWPSTFSFSTLARAESFLPLGLLTAIGFRGALIGLFAHVVGMYCWLATVACIGGALFEWRRELHIQAAEGPEREEERAALELARERDAIMDRLYREHIANAAASVRRLLAEAGRPVDECRWLHARAAQMDDQRLANFLAQLLLPLLLDRGATGEALDVTRQRLRASPDFRPKTSTELARLVELARAAGDRATAARLLEDVERHFGADPQFESLFVGFGADLPAFTRISSTSRISFRKPDGSS
jgi:hypothetical protein